MLPKEEEKDSIQEQTKDTRIQDQEKVNRGNKRREEKEEERHLIP